jgi:hypothetical protein
MDIKQEDLIKFWTWCGLVEQETGSWYENKIGGKYISATMPTLTLDHLYKFAVPKLQEKNYELQLLAYTTKGFYISIELTIVGAKWYQDSWKSIAEFDTDALDPSVDLFTAIMKVIDNEVK